jgi:ATP-binding cassette subfamily F protein 3
MENAIELWSIITANDVLLLDEPTNAWYWSIIWLESFLRNYPGVLVIVSLIKCFLDNVTNRTIKFLVAYDFNKPYSQYLECVLKFGKQLYNTNQKNQKETEKLENFGASF